MLGHFRLCYEDGLERKPELKGSVTVSFGIDAVGNVQAGPSDAGSKLDDASVRACILKKVSSLSFPPPPGDLVKAHFTIELAPDI